MSAERHGGGGCISVYHATLNGQKGRRVRVCVYVCVRVVTLCSGEVRVL